MPKTPMLQRRRLNKSQSVYEALRRSIILGELRPAEPLGELQVAQMFSCSQGPVREALLRLQEEGLVNRLGYRGTIVSAITSEEIVEMLLMRKLIETRGASYAVAKIDDSAIDYLSELVRSMEAAAEEGDEFELSELDRRFHMQVFQNAGLNALEPILERCLLHVHRFKISLSPGGRTLQETAAGHWPIVETLRAGEEVEVKRAITRHIDTVCGGSVSLMSRVGDV